MQDLEDTLDRIDDMISALKSLSRCDVDSVLLDDYEIIIKALKYYKKEITKQQIKRSKK